MTRKHLFWSLGVIGSIVALILAIAPADAATVHGTFTDDNGHPLENGIEAIAAAGITFGCNPPANDRFCPDRTMTRAEAAAFVARALDLPNSPVDYFEDDDGHVLEPAINRLAHARATFGCNPPANDRFCPQRQLTRAEAAAFVARALKLPETDLDHFVDDNGHNLEGAINRIAQAGITLGCNPPENDRFCPNQRQTRAQTAGFVRRARELPIPGIPLPLSNWSAIRCSKDGERCSVDITLGAGTVYRVREGLFNALPYRPGERSVFEASNTRFILRLNGTDQSLTELPIQSSGAMATRYWTKKMTFPAGTHTMVAEWRRNGQVIQRTTATVRATG